MLRIALASLVSGSVGCAGMRPGLANDSGNSSQFSEEGCDDETRHRCGGRGYDDVAVMVTTLAVAGVLIPKLIAKFR